jgi:hypothetical protein
MPTLEQKIKTAQFLKSLKIQSTLIKKTTSFIESNIRSTQKAAIVKAQTTGRGGTTPAYGFEQIGLITGIPSAYNLIKGITTITPTIISTVGKPSIYAFGRFGSTTITKNITKGGSKWLFPALLGGGALGFLLGGGGSIDQKQEAALTQAAAPQEAAPQSIYNISPMTTNTWTRTINTTTANYNQWLNVIASEGSTISGILQSASTSPVSYVTPTVSPQQTIDLSALQEQIQGLAGQIGQEQTAEQGMNPLLLAAIVLGGAFLISGGIKDG